MYSRPSFMGFACNLWKIGYGTRRYHDMLTKNLIPSLVRGIDHLHDSSLNKGLAFTLEERQTLGIHGLQPARFKTQEEQLQLCKIAVNMHELPLSKYMYLSSLHDNNERLFFRFLSENIEELMPIVYTPTVGLACQSFSLVYRRQRGLFVTYNDRGHIIDVIKNFPEPHVRVVCVTDGERILGLGDLGANGMAIPVGKLSLCTALAGIKPHLCLPIVLDVGTNSPHLLEDPLYVGLRQKRVVGQEYDDFIDEFMEAVAWRYGQNILIQFEDFANQNAFRFLDKYRHKYCTFNDDIQGTAAVAVAGFYTAQRITKKSLKDCTFLFAGSGGAATGIANLTVRAMMEDGLQIEEAYSKIYMMDVDGLLTKSRNLDTHQAVNYVKDMPPIQDLAEIVRVVKPNMLIGVSSTGGIFTPDVLRIMAEINERPVIFALSNPTDKAECTAEDAFKYTDARVIFSSGSPFPPVKVGDKTFYPGQGNNAYIFPGLALGVICTGSHHIPYEMFLIAAQELANAVEPSDIERGSLYPPLSKIREVSMHIAVGITQCAYDRNLASFYPEPTDKRKWLESQLYNFNYESSMPTTWTWPNMPNIKTRKLGPTDVKEN